MVLYCPVHCIAIYSSAKWTSGATKVTIIANPELSIYTLSDTKSDSEGTSEAHPSGLSVCFKM